MSQIEDDLEVVSESGATSDEWVKEGSSDVTDKRSPSKDRDTPLSDSNGTTRRQNSVEKSRALAQHERWMSLLGVRNKPDPLVDWDNLYNLKNQSALRRDCRAVLERVGGTSATVPQLESLITLYCKKRNVDYDPESGWLNILGKLILLPFDQPTLFNVFYAITTKYVPRSSKVYDLFRLLLQYHDPQLCSHLNSAKVKLDDFVGDIFKTLLSKDTSPELCFRFWDKYFERGDPFLVFFVTLAFMGYAREQIFSIRDKNEIITLLKQSPGQMGADDVDDLLDICDVFLFATPISVREDFHCLLFGSNLIDECADFPLDTLICLPISVQDLYKRVIESTSSATAPFSYFVIDTRSQKAFNAGSIPGSYNLNGKLIVDEPEKFTMAMTSLIQFKDDSCKTDHICFIGSGLEEDDSYMMMVISRFLHQNKDHISYVDGGYKALHALLADTGNLSKLSNHFNLHDFKCAECTGANNKSAESKGWSLMERMKKVVASQKNLVKSKIVNTSSQDKPEENVKHVNSTDRFGKRYRNVQSVFSISNDDSQESDEDLNFSDIESSTKVTEKLKWSDVIKKPEITSHFQGCEVLPDKSQIPCYIAISRTHMHIFHEVAKETGYVRTSLRQSLSSIMRVTSKKKIPEFLTFKFGYELPVCFNFPEMVVINAQFQTGEAHINRVHCFILPKAGDCAKAIKTGIIALKPSLLDRDDD
ncbi:rab-GTPase-TBC domain-containing protein [Ditylenchus destructor]|nr:rab-GTPase-TBC domain-containing protein [Ditylenchus destructor]